MTDPTTAAGRALLNTPGIASIGSVADGNRLYAVILAIEAEAAAPYREALERLVENWDGTYDYEPRIRGTGILIGEARALLDGSVGSGQTEGLRREVGE